MKSKNLLPSNRFSDLDEAELLKRLSQLNEVRSEVVTRGKALVVNPNYPEREIIDEVSRLLLVKL